MTEEPYRWVEAVANRREYIETQLAEGQPIVALACAEGVLLVTLGSTRQKLFEIYDRIALGAIGHPGDIERLRMAAIELASTEGFTRSAADVSLRRLAYYSLSPMLKGAFEQIYGAPFLARMLFVEIGERAENDLFLRVEYDGAIATNGATISESRQEFGVLSGTFASAEMMETFLRREHQASAPLKDALQTAINAWTVGKHGPRRKQRARTPGCGNDRRAAAGTAGRGRSGPARATRAQRALLPSADAGRDCCLTSAAPCLLELPRSARLSGAGCLGSGSG